MHSFSLAFVDLSAGGAGLAAGLGGGFAFDGVVNVRFTDDGVWIRF